MKSIAHIREEDHQIQTVEEHLLEVKVLAEQYGAKLGVKYIAGLAGLLHDLGKYSDEFHNYIMKSVYEPKEAPVRGSVDHSSAGGKLLYELFHERKGTNIYEKVLAEIVGNAIISHHSYLHDFLSPELASPYLRRVRDKELLEFNQSKQSFFEKVMHKEDFYAYTNKALEELRIFIDRTTDEDREAQLMFLTKYIFSVLIDADRTNARQFANNEVEESRDTQKLFKLYYNKLMQKLDEYSQRLDANSRINLLRANMSKQCENFAERKSGVYTLPIPTGGGKTLASLRYALKHAQLYGKERIIYIVPYTTVIEQNVADVRHILGKDAFILEHHSNAINDHSVDGEDMYSSSVAKKTMLAKDNWDAPIIFTTMVQFLNVFYTDRSRDVRRLHHLANSILIFDEVQKVPTNCISLFNRSLNFLKKFAKSSIVLCTATQPALEYVNHKLEIEPESEMIEDIDSVVEQFDRVNIIDQVTGMQFNQAKLVHFIDKKLEHVQNILIILNTKSVVKELYEVLKEKYNKKIPIYHLSTSMCPSHRTYILDRVREHLNHNEKVICVSTQLIEAGVDISFQTVIRSLAGLDSIAQAAGRCNRHGENASENVYVINYVEENLKYLDEIKKGQEIAKMMLKDLHYDPTVHGGNILSMKAMKYYFKRFYTMMKVDLDYPISGMDQTMIHLLMSKRNENDFLIQHYSRSVQEEKIQLVINNSYRTAAENFKVIDSPTTSIVVPYGKGKKIIAELNGEHNIDSLSELLRESQRYSISVYPYQLDLLIENRSLTTVLDEQVYVLKEGAYDLEYGLNIDGDSEQSFLSF